MNKLSSQQEMDGVDYITDCMYTIDFLSNISLNLFVNQRKDITLKEFYDFWFKKTGSTRKAILPFNPGIFLGYLYVGILYAKQNWFELLPEDKLEDSEESWGLKDAKVSSPKEPNPTIQYVVMRIRNSLGHGRPILTIPTDTKLEDLFAKVTFSFHDVNKYGKKGADDIFDVTLTLAQLSKFIQKFQSVIHRSVREKHKKELL